MMNARRPAVPELRIFHLVRRDDPTGISGTGCVAEGVVFSSGWVAMTWLSDMPTMTFYASVAQLEAIHGHHGTTSVEFDAHECTLLGGRQAPDESVAALAPLD
jgi:hypothetical protein